MVNYSPIKKVFILKNKYSVIKSFDRYSDLPFLIDYLIPDLTVFAVKVRIEIKALKESIRLSLIVLKLSKIECTCPLKSD